MTEAPFALAAFLLVVLFSAFQQTLTGFAFALVFMPVATAIFGLQRAAPLVAFVAITLYAVNLYRYKSALRGPEASRLGLAAAAGVPVGIWALVNVSETAIKLGLGLVLAGYAVYSLVKPAVRPLPASRWVYVVGFLSGCLGGAYNVPGPPVVIYGALRGWPKDEYRAVLQAIFLLTATLTVASHVLAQHVTLSTLALYALSLPALLLGVCVGARFDARVNKDLFRQLVTAMILALGIGMILEIIGTIGA